MGWAHSSLGHSLVFLWLFHYCFYFIHFEYINLYFFYLALLLNCISQWIEPYIFACELSLKRVSISLALG